MISPEKEEFNSPTLADGALHWTLRPRTHSRTKLRELRGQIVIVMYVYIVCVIKLLSGQLGSVIACEYIAYAIPQSEY